MKKQNLIFSIFVKKLSYLYLMNFLTPGPSQLYFTVEDHIKKALKENICAISHRSKTFQQIVAHTISQIRQLMNIPENYYIVFTASATEVWERIIQNLCIENSYHLVNGSFSKKFYDFSIGLKRNASKHEVALGQGFELADLQIPEYVELLCLTHNETSSGVSMPLSDIYELRKKYPNTLIAVDMVSSAPYPDLDFSQIDTAFFSVQKCFGLPAGLGVWVFNERCVEKSLALEKAGINTGTYHSISSLIKNIKNNETPETPNMLGIYLLGKVCEDMNRRTIQAIRTEINYKAGLIYYVLRESKNFEIFVKEEKFRSKTVIVAEVLHTPTSILISQLKEHQITVGSGYGAGKDKQIRIANFPTHSKETFELLADLLMKG
jgi:phosphoserine aminotransferase